MPEVFVSPEEAAWVFETTPQTIRAWIAEEQLRTAPRVGRRHRIFVESVAEKSGLSIDRVREIIQSRRLREAEARGATTESAINKSGAFAVARV